MCQHQANARPRCQMLVQLEQLWADRYSCAAHSPHGVCAVANICVFLVRCVFYSCSSPHGSDSVSAVDQPPLSFARSDVVFLGSHQYGFTPISLYLFAYRPGGANETRSLACTSHPSAK